MIINLDKLRELGFIVNISESKIKVTPKAKAPKGELREFAERYGIKPEVSNFVAVSIAEALNNGLLLTALD